MGLINLLQKVTYSDFSRGACGLHLMKSSSFEIFQYQNITNWLKWAGTVIISYFSLSILPLSLGCSITCDKYKPSINNNIDWIRGNVYFPSLPYKNVMSYNF
jgi:hypothetical protein